MPSSLKAILAAALSMGALAACTVNTPAPVAAPNPVIVTTPAPQPPPSTVLVPRAY